MTDAQLRELLALHALNALEPEDARAVEALLARSAEARAEYAEFVETTARLGRGVPQFDIAPDLKTRVLSAVRASDLEKPRVPTVTPPQSTVTVNPRARVLPFVLGLAAAAAIAALAVLNLQTSDRLRSLEATQRDLETVLSAPGTRVTVLNAPNTNAAIGRAFVAADGRVLFSHNLGAAPAAKTWQLWYIPRGESTPRSLGITGSTTAIAQVPANAGAVAISEEPAGGSAQPTTVRGIATL